ncbi:hypothetical protein DFP72DRAFT_848680 [Ephemerocybe angulata]|uniref:Uncharacterized protein n=1 Tax=Ephemerocybe angulata TaxID=980116 RepID=A0A8H6HVS1_9AGAR|nr:hypothetical protein DFP72DRAFT_848680 [Tulosesus angulatus]
MIGLPTDLDFDPTSPGNARSTVRRLPFPHILSSLSLVQISLTATSHVRTLLPSQLNTLSARSSPRSPDDEIWNLEGTVLRTPEYPKNDLARHRLLQVPSPVSRTSKNIDFNSFSLGSHSPHCRLALSAKPRGSSMAHFPEVQKSNLNPNNSVGYPQFHCPHQLTQHTLYHDSWQLSAPVPGVSKHYLRPFNSLDPFPGPPNNSISHRGSCLARRPPGNPGPFPGTPKIKFPPPVCAGTALASLTDLNPDGTTRDARPPVPGVSRDPQHARIADGERRAINDVETRGKHGGERFALRCWHASAAILAGQQARFPDAEITRFRRLAVEEARRRNAGYIQEAGSHFERLHTIVHLR